MRRAYFYRIIRGSVLDSSVINYNLKMNFLFAYLLKFTLAITPIVITPIIFYTLSPKEAGFYYFMLQVVATLYLIEMGVASSLSRLIPKLKHNRDLEYIKCSSDFLVFVYLKFFVF